MAKQNAPALTAQEVADAWCISRFTLYRWLAAGVFAEDEHYIRVGRNDEYAFRPSALPTSEADLIGVERRRARLSERRARVTA